MTTARPKVNGLVRRFSPFAQFRMMRGLKQSDLAAKTRIHETIVSKIERGVRVATIAQLRQLATALRTTRQRMVDLLMDTRAWAGYSSRRKSGRS